MAENEIKMIMGDDAVAKVKIKYCPMCGRKLEAADDKGV